MARSPFQGTFQPNVRPTVAFAPDALVYINGETDVIGCSNCRKRFDLHKYITNIQVDLNIDSCPGSASITLSIPRHTIDSLYADGVPLLTPMMEVEIYAKGYYLVDGVPQYYPIFWGITTEVTDQYSSGAHTLTINCSDILKWWELCRMNTNPALTAVDTASRGWSIFGNNFSGTNPYDVIWSLCQTTMGDAVVATGSLNSFNGENKQRSTFNATLQDLALYWEYRFGKMRNNLLLYGAQGVAVRGSTLWQKYGNRAGPKASQEVRLSNGGPYGGGMIFDATDPKVTAYKTQMTSPGQVSLWQSEFQTKLEIANAAKEVIGYEFYMDVTGDIVFKPPFYNLDTLPNKPVSWIQDIDIIDWDFSESEAEVVTQIQMSGSFGGNVDYGMDEAVEPMTSVTDWHLLRKYGWRTQPITSGFLGNPKLMFYHGMDLLDRLNSRRHRGSVSIPLRPELRLGFPVYVAPKDQMWYLTGISHNISFGGSAQTTLTLAGRRTKFFAPRGIGKLTFTGLDEAAVSKAENSTAIKAEGNGTFKYTVRQLSEAGTFSVTPGEAASMPPEDIDVFNKPADQNPYTPMILRHPKTGRACGFPNVVMAYTRPFALVESPANTGVSQAKRGKGKQQVRNADSKKSSDPETENKATEQLNKEQQDLMTNTEKKGLLLKHMHNRYQYGLNSAGVFAYLYDEGEAGTPGVPTISEALLIKTSRVKVKAELNEAQKKFILNTQGNHSSMIRPVSDERGFEVIGHFRYGRGLSLRDGSLQRSDGGNPNQRASISLQTPLQGDLQESLMAQSLGVTSELTSSQNPAADLATLTPSDAQTATTFTNENGKITPSTTFLNVTSEKFIQTYPLGVTESLKIPDSVEATQLSRALSLAEMTVKEGAGATEACDCMMARTDLAFLYVPKKIAVENERGVTEYIDDSTRNSNAVPTEKALPVGNPEEVAKKVNDFLWNLYALLDKDHQEVEKKLRGQYTEAPAGSTATGQKQANESVFAPPFDIPSLFDTRGVSLDAIVSSVGSNVEALSEAFSTLSDGLIRGTVIKYYEGQLNIRQKEVANIMARLAELRQRQQQGIILTTFLDDVAALEKALEKATREMEEAALRVDILRNGGAISDAEKAAARSASSSPTATYGSGVDGATKTYGG